MSTSIKRYQRAGDFECDWSRRNHDRVAHGDTSLAASGLRVRKPGCFGHLSTDAQLLGNDARRARADQFLWRLLMKDLLLLGAASFTAGEALGASSARASEEQGDRSS
jgi:hypothetical protein